MSDQPLMIEGYSIQYDTSAVILREGQGPDADTVIAYCRDIGAIFYEDSRGDQCFVVSLRPKVGPELWTERALRGSLPKAATDD